MLTLWDPFFPIKQSTDGRLSTKSYFDRLFEESFSNMTHDLFANFPITGIQNHKNEDGTLSVSIDVPGVKEEDISVELKNNMLSVKGERKSLTSSQSISKSFSIPKGYDSNNIKAELVNGVLTLTLSLQEIKEPEIKKIAITSQK